MGEVGGGGELGIGNSGGARSQAEPLCLAEERRGESTLSFLIPAPRPGPERPLTRAGSAATALVPAQPLNPEPAEPEPQLPAASTPTPPRWAGLKRLHPPGGLRRRGRARPPAARPPPRPHHSSAPASVRRSCSFRICTGNNIQVLLRVPAAVGGRCQLV